jgi:hypothetical protein
MEARSYAASELWQQRSSGRLRRRKETVLHFQVKVYNQPAFQSLL